MRRGLGVPQGPRPAFCPTPYERVLLREWLGICYNGPYNVDPKSPELCHERSFPVQMAHCQADIILCAVR
jgi:hypothetical protein